MKVVKIIGNFIIRCMHVREHLRVQRMHVHEHLRVQRMHVHEHLHVQCLSRADHIASIPVALLPLPELIALCRRYDKLILVDGAHAPGQVQLNLEALGANFYTGQLASI